MAAAGDPEVFTSPPPQPKEKKAGQLLQWQLEQYFEKGFVVVPSFFHSEELAPVVAAIAESVSHLADKLFEAGKISSKHEDAGFYERLTLLNREFEGTAVLLHKRGYLLPAFQQLWANERLLNVVEQLIGPDIAAHPVWNLRPKIPHNEQTTVPWHQDNAYLDPSCAGTLQPTAWIPLIDATVETGCLQMVSGGHHTGKTAKHTCCVGDTWYVGLEEAEMESTLGVDTERDTVTCDVPMGGVLFFNNCIPHRSLENRSSKIRWSLDLRWQHPNKPNGFYGRKDCLTLRQKSQPNLTVDWEPFASWDRTSVQSEIVGHFEDTFDTTVHGPWMNRWEIVHHNRHTASMESDRDMMNITKA